MVQITKDEAYDAVAPDDFPAMLDTQRYGARTTALITKWCSGST